jgi:hydrogenase-1 operon protein HyaF
MGSLMKPGDAAQFNIHIGGELTLNVQPIMHQIRHALNRLLSSGETTVIDLRSIPLAPTEESTILEILGRGEVRARLDALGPSEIIETECAGVWLVTHYNENDSTVSRFIEITEMPDILKSQHCDMSTGLLMLSHKLEALDT